MALDSGQSLAGMTVLIYAANLWNTTLVAVDVSLIAWLAQNYRAADFVLLVLAFVAVVGTTVAIIGVNRAAFRRMAELRRL